MLGDTVDASTVTPELGACPVKAGDMVMGWCVSAANHDPHHDDDVDEVRLDRSGGQLALLSLPPAWDTHRSEGITA